MFAVEVRRQKGAGERAGGRKGKPIGTVGHGRRVQFSAGKLGTVRPGSTLEMRPFEAVRTTFFSFTSATASSDLMLQRQTQEQGLKKP